MPNLESSKRLKRFAVVTTLLAFILSCAGASGPSEQIVKEQVTQCLNSLQLRGYSFPDYFEIQTVVLKDRMVKQNECTVVVDFTTRFKQNYSSSFNEARVVFGNLVHQQGKTGDIVTNSLTITFKLFEKGWRIDCT